MRISSRAHVLDYLGSTPNLLGSELGGEVGATIPQKLTPVTLSWHVRGVSGERASVIAGYPRRQVTSALTAAGAVGSRPSRRT